MVEPGDILGFWFSTTMRQHWFASTPELDTEIRNRFESTWERAQTDGLNHWRVNADGCLALAIVLDQLPLNMYRGQTKSFLTEALSREVAHHAIANGFDRQLSKEQKSFLYMPFMHSEKLEDQDYSVSLFKAAGLEDNLKFAKHHRSIVKRFGRFPHRNAILGRDNTPEELSYLQSDEAFTG